MPIISKFLSINKVDESLPLHWQSSKKVYVNDNN